MKLGCNLSNELIELIEGDRISVDYVKIALASIEEEIPLKYKEYGKLLLHGVGLEIPQHSGSNNTNVIDWKLVNQHLKVCESDFYGIHFGTYKDDWDKEEVSYEMIKSRMSSFVSSWKENICCDLLVENVPYTDYYHLNSPRVIKESVNPKLISEICEEHNIGMILDIAHAKIAAAGQEISFKDYLDQLPLSRIKEIHVVGTQSTDTGLRDKHAEMIEEDFELLHYVLGLTKPDLITLEYGGFGDHFANRSDINAIERQLVEIRKIIEITNKNANVV